MLPLYTQPLLAEALITWTVDTYYIAIAICHFLTLIIGFKVLQADAESKLGVGSVVVAIAVGVAGYMTKNMELFGLMITGSTIFLSILLVSAGDALRSLILSVVCMFVYAGVGNVVVPRTPLTAERVGGFTKAFMVGVEEKPLSSEEDLYEHTQEGVEDSLDEDDE